MIIALKHALINHFNTLKGPGGLLEGVKKIGGPCDTEDNADTSFPRLGVGVGRTPTKFKLGRPSADGLFDGELFIAAHDWKLKLGLFHGWKMTDRSVAEDEIGRLMLSDDGEKGLLVALARFPAVQVGNFFFWLTPGVPEPFAGRRGEDPYSVAYVLEVEATTQNKTGG
jgi:hypothetical protein